MESTVGASGSEICIGEGSLDKLELCEMRGTGELSAASARALDPNVKTILNNGGIGVGGK